MTYLVLLWFIPCSCCVTSIDQNCHWRVTLSDLVACWLIKLFNHYLSVITLIEGAPQMTPDLWFFIDHSQMLTLSSRLLSLETFTESMPRSLQNCLAWCSSPQRAGPAMLIHVNRSGELLCWDIHIKYMTQVNVIIIWWSIMPDIQIIQLSISST